MLLRIQVRKFSRKHSRISDSEGVTVLERSLSTNIPGKGSPKARRTPRKGFRVHHEIVTLDPNKFAEKKQQCLHIGNLQSFLPRISQLKQWSPAATPTKLHYAYNSTIKRTPYPPDTKAFLYYFKSPEKPRISGELRLRVTSGNDAAFFESGSDLLRPDGHPWSRPLYVLSKFYRLLYEKLRDDQFIPDDLDTVLAALPSKIYQNRRSPPLYSLNDTFIVDFSSHTSFFVITERGVRRLTFNGVFVDNEWCTPYTGSALARWERSTLPDHIGTRTVLLRFLKIITPVKCVIPQYDGHIRRPKEGELYRKSGTQKVWSVNIDKSIRIGPDSIVPGLKLLWDA